MMQHDLDKLTIFETLQQGLREFWLPFLIAALISFFSLNVSKVSWLSSVTPCLATFFFVSVFTGHWNRIRYQGGTKQKLRKIEIALQCYNEATQSLASTQQRIVELIVKVSAIDTADLTLSRLLLSFQS